MDVAINKNIPSKKVSYEVVKQILQMAKWSRIHPFLIDNGYIPKTEGSEKQSKKALIDLDTFVVALLLYNNYATGEEPYTLRSLAIALDDEDFNAIKAMEKRLKLLLERIIDYNVIKVYRDIHRGKRECLRIEATDLLIKFIETECFQ